MEDKQVLVKNPEWLESVEDDKVAGAVFALLFSWQWDGKAKEIDNLREYVKGKFDDMSDDEIAQICDLLIEHKVVK